uniref:Uncharacterized protein n=1 Tax=Chromera velia CCMP2878 TaxID=1169474 RepID=A0A0G4HAC4_9ALVE|eukprot:Cvel_6025.t1-p1 / transcript=Cvel_6025.t1 / gene=Cvel_6025 / organism=Chromera_velia_CCMP2878 / gene_product=hypothetical protein / transcript_product=hypothetical protein / location=Cvel_scaffold289:19574-20518(+) / protein_length=133 / sequence_SO=supercontig / SO=protein_coding / is_pseudo=false
MLAIRYYTLIFSGFLDTLLSKEDLWACIGSMGTFRMPSFVEAWAQNGGVQVLAPEKVDETNFKKMFNAPLVIVFRGNALGFLFGKTSGQEDDEGQEQAPAEAPAGEEDVNKEPDDTGVDVDERELGEERELDN